MLKKIVKGPYLLFRSLLFDPVLVIKKLAALPYYFRNLAQYRRLNSNASFDPHLKDAHYCSYDRFCQAGSARGHYFHQDLWAARRLYELKPELHVDVGSRLDGFVCQILPFCKLCYVDLRPLEAEIEGFQFRQGSILEMPFEDNSIASLSCLHVIEHIGLGRYGDPIDPEGYIKAARELTRVLSPGGTLLLGTPVGRERLCFDAHRIFSPETVVKAFEGLSLKRFSLIDDKGCGIITDASFEQAKNCEFGCGLFEFEKKEGDAV